MDAKNRLINTDTLAERVLNAELDDQMKPRRGPGTGVTALQRRRS